MLSWTKYQKPTYQLNTLDINTVWAGADDILIHFWIGCAFGRDDHDSTIGIEVKLATQVLVTGYSQKSRPSRDPCVTDDEA